MKKREFEDWPGIRQRIKALRGPLSQRQLSEKLGVCQTWISEIELGKKPPSEKFINDLTDLYPGVTPEQIITGIGFEIKAPVDRANEMRDLKNDVSDLKGEVSEIKNMLGVLTETVKLLSSETARVAEKHPRVA